VILLSACGGSAAPASTAPAAASVKPAASASTSAKPAASAAASANPAASGSVAAKPAASAATSGEKLVVSHSQLTSTPNAAASADDTSIRAALPKFGLDPAKDVILVPVGPEPARVAALINGQIQATDATPKAVMDLEAAGFHALFDIAELGLPAATAAIAAQR